MATEKTTPGRRMRGAALCALVLIGTSSAAQAALVICNQPTRNVTCSAGTCTATAKGATLNIAALVNMLNSGDVTVAAGSKAKDIDIGAPFSWANAHRLTLNASSGSVTVDHPLTVAGPGGLTLTTGCCSGPFGNFSFVGSGHVTFWDLSSSLIINGHGFTLVNSVPMLASAIAGGQCFGCALANNYDASVDGTYASAPIPTFSNWFEGLGNAISNLSINDQTNGRVGLFAFLNDAYVRDVKFLNANIVAGRTFNNGGTSTGALAGYSEYGHIYAVFTNGTVTGPDKAYAGGVIGSTQSMSEFVNNHSSATVSGGNYARVGGLVGYYYGLPIQRSDASGNVSAGLTSFVGGLVGYSESWIYDSHASGAVSGGENATAGGLVGKTFSDVKTSFATGKVTVAKVSHGTAGGLVGLLGLGTISSSYATGDVQGTQGGTVGGLVGTANSGTTISWSYAKGAAALPTYSGSVGGLIGSNMATLSQVYSIGPVSGGAGAFLGGLIGSDGASAGSITSAYWDLDTSGVSDPAKGAGFPLNDPGITGLTDAQLKSGLPAGFDPAVWGQSPAINNGYPYLLAVPPG